MKTLKLVRTALLITVISILAGCSDNITSSGEATTEKAVNVTTVEEGLPIINPPYRVEIRLKPFRSYKFEAFRTGFIKFTSLNVNNLSIDPNEDKYVTDCQFMNIYSTGTLTKVSLSCHENKLDVKDIIIENRSSKFLDLDVILTGDRVHKNVSPYAE